MDHAAQFDRDALHPEAAKAFDKAATALLDRFEPYMHQGQTEPFETRHQPEIVHVLSSPPAYAFVNYAERTTGWCLQVGGGEFTLREDGYRAMRDLVGRIRQKQPFRHGFSDYFLENLIAVWCAEMRGEKPPAPFAIFLLNRCAEAYQAHHFLMPLVGVEVEHDFRIGLVGVRIIPIKLFQQAADEARKRHPDDPHAGGDREKLGRELANHTGVEVIVCGEPRFADDRALEIADDVAGLLRFLSPAAISSTVPSLVQPWGVNVVHQTLLLKTKDGRLSELKRQWLHGGLAQWKLSAREIARLSETRLANLSWFFDGRTLNDYGQHVRPAFFAYCRAIGRFDPVDRLLGTITALERLLLRNENEPLQQMVGERLAFLTAAERVDRLQTLADYKAAYRLRSAAVHHLRGIDDEEVADRLFRHAFLAFHRAVEALPVFSSHVAFLDGIDHIKFGGRYRSADGDVPSVDPSPTS